MPTRNLFPILAQLPGYVSVHSLDDRILWANRIGYGLPDGVIGQPSTTYIVDEDRPIWQNAFARAKYNREIVNYRLKIITPDPPGWVSLDGRMGPYVENDAVKYVIVLTQDATFQPARPAATSFLLGSGERAVVAALLARSPLKATAIAHRIGDPHATSILRTILSALVNRGVLVSGKDGYSIAAEFRHLAIEVLR